MCSSDLFYGGGSSPYTIPYHDSRGYGWMAGYHDFVGFGYWVYYHWTESEKIVIPYSNGTLNTTPVWEGLRDGKEDGELYTILKEMIDYLESKIRSGDVAGGARIVLDGVKKDLEGVIGLREDSILKFEDMLYGASVKYEWRDIRNSSTEDYRLARRKVLELIMRLKPYVDDMGCDLVRGKTYLVEDGISKTIIVVGDKATHQEISAAERLAKAIEDNTGVQIIVKSEANLDASDKELLVPILIGTEETNKGLATALDEVGVKLTPEYPGKGRYILRDSMLDEKSCIILYANDEAGLNRGIDVFLNFTKLKGGYL